MNKRNDRTRPFAARTQQSRKVGDRYIITEIPKYRKRVAVGVACTELVPTLDGTALTVSIGYVNSMIPEIDSDALNADPIPELTVSGATSLWLLIDWTVVLTGTAPDKTIASSTAENARFVLATSQAELLPSTDGTAATDGLQAVRWAEITSDGEGGYILTPIRCGSNQVSYCEGLGGYLMRFERLSS